jgi:hypothetical protein
MKSPPVVFILPSALIYSGQRGGRGLANTAVDLFSSPHDFSGLSLVLRPGPRLMAIHSESTMKPCSRVRFCQAGGHVNRTDVASKL